MMMMMMIQFEFISHLTPTKTQHSINKNDIYNWCSTYTVETALLKYYDDDDDDDNEDDDNDDIPRTVQRLIL